MKVEDGGALIIWKLAENHFIGIRPVAEQIIHAKNPNQIRLRHKCLEARERRIAADVLEPMHYLKAEERKGLGELHKLQRAFIVGRW